MTLKLAKQEKEQSIPVRSSDFATQWKNRIENDREKDVTLKLAKQEKEQKLSLSVRVILQRSGKIVSRTTGKRHEAEAD